MYIVYPMQKNKNGWTRVLFVWLCSIAWAPCTLYRKDVLYLEYVCIRNIWYYILSSHVKVLLIFIWGCTVFFHYNIHINFVDGVPWIW